MSVKGRRGEGAACLTLDDFGIKLQGRVLSHFNVALIVQGKVTRQCPLTTICEENLLSLKGYHHLTVITFIVSMKTSMFRVLDTGSQADG